MSEHKFHVVITFPESIFPRDEYKSEEEFEGAQVRLLDDWIQSACQQAIVREERGESGNFHLDCVLGFKTNRRTTNLKRSIFKALDIDYAQQLEMSPAEKRHCIMVKNVNYVPGVMAYNAKEGRTVHIQKGFTDTWIQQQVREGIKNKEVVNSKRLVFVNDSNFYWKVREYYENNNMQGEALRGIVKAMIKDGYSFVRVRNLKWQLAEWKLRVEDNDSNHECLWNNLEF